MICDFAWHWTLDSGHSAPVETISCALPLFGSRHSTFAQSDQSPPRETSCARSDSASAAPISDVCLLITSPNLSPDMCGGESSFLRFWHFFEASNVSCQPASYVCHRAIPVIQGAEHWRRTRRTGSGATGASHAEKLAEVCLCLCLCLTTLFGPLFGLIVRIVILEAGHLAPTVGTFCRRDDQDQAVVLHGRGAEPARMS